MSYPVNSYKVNPKAKVIGGASLEEGFEARDREDKYQAQTDTRVQNIEPINFAEYIFTKESSVIDLEDKNHFAIGAESQTALYFNNGKEVAEETSESVTITETKDPDLASEVAQGAKEAGKIIIEKTNVIDLKIAYDVTKEAVKDAREFIQDFWDLLKGDIFFVFKPKAKESADHNDQKKKKASFNPVSYIGNWLRGDNKRAMDAQKENINQKLKMGNISFEGVLENGQIRVDIQAALDKANSQLEAEQIKAKREASIASLGSKGKKVVDHTMSLKQHEGSSRIQGPTAAVG